MRRLLVLALSCATLAPGTARAQSAGRPRPPDCSAPEHHQFDFWIGTWDVYDPKGAKIGSNVIRPILNGCALHEHWEAPDGEVGESLSAYDRVVKAWHQTWIDGVGSVWKTDGTLRDGAMVLTRAAPLTREPGVTALHRWTWTAGDRDHVRQLYEISRDGGTTWKPLFDGRYVRRK